MSENCNKNYFTKLIVFITLYRENVNQTYEDKESEGKKYTENHSSEDIPECSNVFIVDFLYNDQNDKEYDFEKEEAINLTQNFCSWLYDNNFTCSKLTLL